MTATGKGASGTWDAEGGAESWVRVVDCYANCAGHHPAGRLRDWGEVLGTGLVLAGLCTLRWILQCCAKGLPPVVWERVDRSMACAVCLARNPAPAAHPTRMQVAGRCSTQSCRWHVPH